tara:strand:- start:19 stop:894 length:876 start_codon:yes stop_codon:yes gene_type:complete
MTIKHIVFSGGSYKILYMIGIIKYLRSVNYYKISDIETIRATSAGSILSLLLILDLDFNNIENFVINKPWEKSLKITTESILNAIYSKGFLNVNFIRDIFANHFKHKNLKLDLTMKELYEYSNIEFYVYAFNISTFEGEVFSYKNFPDLKVLDAIYMSCSLPFAFEPMKYKSNFYLDGGIEIEYPLNDTVKECENTDEILSICVKTLNNSEITMTDDINILNYGIYLFEKLIGKHRIKDYKKIKNEIIIPSKAMNISDLNNLISNKEERRRFILDGEKFAVIFLEYIKEQN